MSWSRTKVAKARILYAHAQHDEGLTDYECAVEADLLGIGCWRDYFWKLRKQGFLVFKDPVVTRRTGSTHPSKVSVLTDEGKSIAVIR